MFRTKPNRNNQKFPAGATSLLIVTAIALVFVAIVSGLTAFSIREARQALDTDLSNRAYSAALASARDASQWVSENPGKQYPNCDGSGATPGLDVTDPEPNLIKYQISDRSDNSNVTNIVCRTISIDAAQVQLQAQKDKTVEALTYLPSGTPVTRMNLQWGKVGGGSIDMNSLYPTSANYNNNTPAIIELSLVYWPKTGSAQVGEVSAADASNPEGLAVKTDLIEPESTICGSSLNVNGYYCSADIDFSGYISNPASNNIVVIIRPRYANADLQMQFFNGASASPVAVRPSAALIDVTASIGGFYRRVQAQKAISGNSFINDVLYSNSNICKNLTVTEKMGLISGNNCS